MSDVNLSSEEDEKRYVALPALKCRSKAAILLKQRRQKFCAKWTNTFPWLRPDNVDESIGFCTVCDKRLVCKKSHLERHESSFKHQRSCEQNGVPVPCDSNAANDIETSVPEFLECGKQEPTDDGLDFETDNSLDCEIELPKMTKSKSTCESKEPSLTNSVLKNRNKTKLNRVKLLQRIDRERQELNEYFYSRQAQNSNSSLTQQELHTSKQSRDTFDLFFESVSASVKTLPPKLASEVKIRVSQIVAEFELRAICEREALEHTGSLIDDSTMVVASTTSHDVDELELTTEETTAVSTVAGTQILYTFQPKLRE